MNKPRIVIIDDEADFVDTLKEYFALREYEIYATSKVVEGIELINTKKPDVIILDLKMSGISGEEILSLIKSKGLKTKVVFVSAFDDMGKTKAHLLAKGAYAYLDKPVSSLKELETVVNRAYGEREEVR